MPCTYSTIDIQERERAREARRLATEEAERRRKEEIARKKKALIIALDALGFDLSAASLGNGKLMITGKKE